MNLLQSVNKYKKDIKKANGLLNVAIKNKDESKVDEAFGIADDARVAGTQLIFAEQLREDIDVWYFMDLIDASNELDAAWKEVLDRMCKFYLELYL